MPPRRQSGSTAAFRRSHARQLWHVFFWWACVLLASRSSLAQESTAAPAPPSAPIVLPELPEVPNSSFGRPTEEAMQELKDHLKRVRSADPVIRERAVREILEAKPSWVPAIYHHLNHIADDADSGAMKETLRKIRDKARDAVREKMRRAGEKGKVVTPDYLQMVAEYAEPKSESWQALITVLAMSRMLVAVGTVEAARALIQIYVRFGEFLRVDTQLQLAEMGDRAAPALIEARKHPAQKIGRWADRQLDQMGKAIASELVQTEDQQALADILRAYGRIQDPDAARIIISFANSERAQIRLAARQGVRLMGEVGHWQLRETYQNIVGKTPPRDWSWKRTARELFHEFDRLRLAQVHEHFEKGMAAQKKGDLATMRDSFDKVLANNPMFDHRDEMVDGYVTFAEQAGEDKLDEALLAARRAERINSDPKREAKLESLRLTLEGEQLLARGIADQSLFRRAVEKDPQNQRARQGIAAIERGERVHGPEYSRYYGAGAIGVVALAAILLILLWRPKGGEAIAAPATADTGAMATKAEAEPTRAADAAEPALTVGSPEPAPAPDNAESAQALDDAEPSHEPATSDANETVSGPTPEEAEPRNDEPRPPDASEAAGADAAAPSEPPAPNSESPTLPADEADR